LIVRSIKIAAWRCFLQEFLIGTFDDGLNIIHASNGTGKSTLFEALRRALLDGHKVAGRDIEAIRPWGRQLAPRVTVEFVHGGQEYRISKQYLDSPRALLERKENGRYRGVAEGTSADEQTRDILTKNPPGRGLARLENWGLAQILWAPQGNLAIGPLAGEVVSDIRNMLGAQVLSTSSGPVEKKIEELFLQFFSAKGKLKSGKDAPLLSRLRDEMSRAATIRQEAHGLYLEFEEASRRVEECQARKEQTRHDADEIAKALSDALGVAENYRKLVIERDQRTERVNAAEAQYNELKQRIDLIKSMEKDLAEAGNSLTTLESTILLSDKEVLEREREATKRKAELEDARKDREAVDAAAQLAATAHRFNECTRELRRTEGTISKIRKAEKVLAEFRQKRNAHVAPDVKTLRAIRKAISDGDSAQLRLQASLITLEIVPHKKSPFEVVSGEKPGSIQLETGVPVQVQGSPEIVVELPNVARLRAWGPVGSAEEHRETRKKAQQKLRELTEPFGTSDPDALESLAEKAKELDESVSAADTTFQTLIAGRTVDEFVIEQRVLEATRNGFIGSHPDWENSSPDEGSLETQAIELKNTFIANVESCEEAWEKAQSALTAVAGQKETLSHRREDTRKRIADLNGKLADLSSDEKVLQERETELKRIALAWDAAKTRLSEILDQLGEYKEDPLAVAKRLERQVESAGQAAVQAREQELIEEPQLEGLSAKGTYSALVLAEEKVAQLEQSVKREELRVEAIRFLHETVAACRNEAIARVAGPVEAIATRTLQRIAGGRLGLIQVGEAFEPTAVVPDSIEQAVALDNLSGGELEQLYLATRLALAEVLARKERQLVVLDDVLTATDTGRLARVMNVLEEAAQQLQVLVLTCHPERYRGLDLAAFFDLEKLLYEAKQRQG
jgi:hypothetical protein